MDGSFVSIAEHQTYLRFLKFGQREDNRAPFDYRGWDIVYTKDRGSCIANLGSTTIMCCVKVSAKRTKKLNQTRGISRVDVSLTPLSFSKFLPNRKRMRTLRKQLRQHIKSSVFWSKCVDDETLCISKGKAIFQVQVSIDVVHADGNLFDAVCLASVACLLNAQRPEIVVEGNQIIALSTYKKTPIPLQVNHIPVSTTFGFQPASHFIVVDPSGKEDIVLDGSLTVVVNQNGEICGTYKRGIAVLPVETIGRCAEIAALRAKEVAVRLRQIAEADADSRSKNEPTDVISNIRRLQGDRMDVEETRPSISKVEQELLASATIGFTDTGPRIVPKDVRKLLPGVGEMSDDEAEEIDADDSEEEMEMLESYELQ